MKPTGHTNLFNADCNVWMYKYRPQSAFYRPPGEPLTSELIGRYVDVIADAGEQAARLEKFLGTRGKAAVMAQAVDSSLYRNRRGA